MIIFSFVYLVEKIDRQKPLHLTLQNHIIYINSVSLCVYNEGFGGWGRGEAGEATAISSEFPLIQLVCLSRS